MKYYQAIITALRGRCGAPRPVGPHQEFEDEVFGPRSVQFQLPRTLLLVNGFQNPQNVGEIFLAPLLRMFPQGKLRAISTASSYMRAHRQAWNGVEVDYHPTSSSSLPIVSSLQFRRFRVLEQETLLKIVQKSVREHSCEAIWAILNTPAIIWSALTISRAVRLPLYSMVLDPLQFVTHNICLDPAVKQIEDRFVETLQNSQRVAVIGPSMAAEYRARYGVEATSIVHGVPPHLWRLGSRPASAEGFTIAFAGSLYAKQEWRSLLEGLRINGNRVGGRPVKIVFFGRKPLTGVPMPELVEFRGPVELHTLVDALNQADVCYLPYWFDERRSDIVRLSFPTKLSTYVASGTPVLYHGPLNSSPTAFMEQYPVGVCCHDLSPRAVVSALERCAPETGIREAIGEPAQRALSEHLGLPAMARCFQQWLRA